MLRGTAYQEMQLSMGGLPQVSVGPAEEAATGDHRTTPAVSGTVGKENHILNGLGSAIQPKSKMAKPVLTCQESNYP